MTEAKQSFSQRGFFALAVVRYEILKGFRRTTFGILWHLPSHLMFIVGIGIVSSAVFGQALSTRLVHGSLGYLAFVLLSGPLLNSTQYQFRFPILETSILPAYQKSVVGFAMHFLDFLIAAVVLLPIALGFTVLEPTRIVKMLLVVAITIPMLYGIGSMLAIANLRFRDTEPLVQMLGRLWFITLPVFWDESLLKSNSIQEHLLVSWNPFGAAVVSFRSAALGYDIVFGHILVILAVGLVVLSISLVSHSVFNNSIKTLILLSSR